MADLSLIIVTDFNRNSERRSGDAVAVGRIV